MTSNTESGHNPFASKRTSRRRNAMIVAGILSVSTGAAFILSQSSSGRESNAESHAHGAGAAPEKSQPLMISAADAKRIGVTFAPVISGPLSREIRTVAQVTYDETRVRTISPKVDGWVEQLYVNYTGQPIRAGQPVLAVYSPMLVAAQEEMLLASRLTRSLSGAESDVRLESRDLEAASRRRLQYWDISPAEIEGVLRSGQARRTMTLRSPFGGVVVEKNVFAGQRIMAGEALYKVADLSTVWIEGEVFERDLPSIRVGAEVSTEFDALPGEQRSGRIAYVYPTLNPETRTARIRVPLPNPGMRLKPGMYATIRIAGASTNAVTVPRSAILATGDRTLVFVRRKDGMLEPRNVTIGESTQDRTTILSGVAVGESVVASATFLVDSESNLGTSLGGMGDMPGMDMTAPAPRKE
jgi:Cu(I)/Ag(I) efflux system membrane fusion protein